MCKKVYLCKKIAKIMPTFIFILFVALLPVAVLIYYIYRKDKYQQEPPGEMLRAFCYGVGAAFLSLLFTTPLSSFGVEPVVGQSMFSAISKAFYMAAIPEETAKLIMLWLFLRRCKYFDEHMDGIVYAVCVSMGFAAIENVLYLLGNVEDFISLGISRGLFSIPGHFFFGVLMGYYYSLAKFCKKDNSKYLVLTLLVPILGHGCFDALLFVGMVAPSLSFVLTIVFLFFCDNLRRHCSKKIEEHLKRDLLDLK